MVNMYLSPEGARNLHTYKYCGGDKSILYVHLLSPLAEVISTQVPNWVSANLVSSKQISYAGHLCLMAGYVLCWAFCGLSLACSPPTWVLWAALGLQLTWLVLDNVDGKQARKLGISSPLGLLFDHQVDALCLFSTATLVSIVSGFGDSPYSLGCWTGMMVPFFFSTWEELHTGRLEFPTYTGPSEGVLLLCSYLAFMIYQTPEQAATFLVAGYPLPTVIFWGMNSLAALNAVVSTWRVTVNSDHPGKIFTSSLAFLYIILAVVSALWLSPASVGSAAARESIIFLGFVFSLEMAHMQLAHVTSTAYSPLSCPNFLLLTAFMANTLTHHLGYGLIDEYHLLVCLAVLAVLAYCHMAYVASHEISQELGIPILQTPKTRKR